MKEKTRGEKSRNRVIKATMLNARFFNRRFMKRLFALNNVADIIKRRGEIAWARNNDGGNRFSFSEFHVIMPGSGLRSAARNACRSWFSIEWKRKRRRKRVGRVSRAIDLRRVAGREQ